MNVRPLIVRELRAEARRANTYWLRSLSAGLLTAIFVWSVLDLQRNGDLLGPMLFDALSKGLLLATLTVIAGITADTISREKREGTLGLLFLTPLRANDVVVGKTLLHGLRAVALFIGVAPIVSLPFLLGGIATQSLLTFAVTLPAAVMIAVASGVLASIHSSEWIESIVWAELICAGFCALFVIAEFLAFAYIQNNFLGRVPRWIGFFWAFVLAAEIIYSTAILFWSIHFASRRLEATWQRDSVDTHSWWIKFFSNSTFWRAAFHWNTKKARDRNPIAWLQEYNWSSRLTKWGWCIMLFTAQWRTVVMPFREFMTYQMNLYRLVAIGIAFSAAASFRRERQTGALELLLVTPISAGKLIWGRLQGVWVHFFPAIAILACVWTMGPRFLSLPLWFAWYLVGAYLCIPIIGFYCSLLTSNVLVAWLLTLFFGQYMPYAITEAFRFNIGRQNVPIVFASIQATFALVAGILLYENLTKRRFALKR